MCQLTCHSIHLPGNSSKETDTSTWLNHIPIKDRVVQNEPGPKPGVRVCACAPSSGGACAISETIGKEVTDRLSCRQGGNDKARAFLERHLAIMMMQSESNKSK